jgi:hypothetical protein
MPDLDGIRLKSDLINALSDIHGYRSYLEVCVPGSGNQYGLVDRSKYPTCRRLVYRCPDDWDDGHDIHFRSGDLQIDDCIGRIKREGLRFDIMLLDPWHEYETSYRDIAKAFALVVNNGMIIVHDCLPPDVALADPKQFGPGGWCGVTYKAFLDFVTSRNDVVYCTVDTDFGCGVIRKKRLWDATLPTMEWNRRALLKAWRGLGNDYAAAFRFYEQHRQMLLKVVTVADFLAAEQERSCGWLHRLFARPRG